MSVILDALRKLDREKSSRRNGVANIAVEILRPDLPSPGKKIPLYIPVIAITAFAAAGITYAVMVKFGFLSRSSPTTPVSLSTPSQQVAPATVESKLPLESFPAPASPPAQNQEVVPASISSEPISGVRDKLNQVPPKIQAPAESKTPVAIKPPETPLDVKKAIIPERADAVPGSAKKTVETTPNVSSTTPPSLKLSAIVWYDEPSKRFAMINGLKAIEGSEIEGVKVVEINPTSVRFLHNDRYFEISITR